MTITSRPAARSLTLALGSLSLLATALAAAVPPEAHQWPRFRGHNGTGIAQAEAIPIQWTEADYNWRTRLPGTGHSSPTVWGDKLFVTCADREAATRILVCLKTSDGSTLWTREFESKPFKHNRLNSPAASNPAVGPLGVYVCWSTPEAVTVVGLSHDGKDLWSQGIGPFRSQHGPCQSPIVFRDLVVLPNDQLGKSFLIAFDAATGKTRWQVDRRSAKSAYATPCVYKPDDGPQELIFTSTANGVTSIDPATGEVNWEFPAAFPLRVVASPVLAEGLVVNTCGTGGSGRRLVAVRPGSKKSGAKPELVYELKRALPYVPTCLAHGDRLFLLAENGTATCVRAATGETVWQKKLDARFYGSFIHAAGRLYAIDRKGDALVVDPKTGDTLARNPLGEPSQATPAVAGGVLYLRTLSHVISIGGK